MRELRFDLGLPNLSERSLFRWITLYKHQGSAAFQPRYHSNAGRPGKLTERHERLLIATLERQPDMYLRELGDGLERWCGVRVSRQTLSRTLRRLGWSRKVSCTVHVEQDPLKQAAYVLKVAHTAAADLFFLDETAVRQDASWRHQGWSARGSRADRMVTNLGGPRHTLCGVVGMRDGLVQGIVTPHSFNKAAFQAFIREHVVSSLSTTNQSIAAKFTPALLCIYRYLPYLASPS